MPTAIQVENLGKKYTLNHRVKENYKTFRDALSQTARAIWGSLIKPAMDRRRELSSEEFWAIKDISFEVKQGERVGIIGRNGAGKSTLLKLISRITEPTAGRICLRGRVATLLEVGTGFHPELTGRENIALNGAILGMTKVEIRRKFDEIVAFAEIENFLDTPVKRYSSGMYVRLAFAVAAHLEPEILLVDEVLAVGDASFQKKCLGKMEEVSQKQGRTVLFVSHNMGAIATLCDRAMLLDSGSLAYCGDTQTAISRYLTDNDLNAPVATYKITGEAEIEFQSVEILDGQCNPRKSFFLSSEIKVKIGYVIHRPIEMAQIVCHLWNSQKIHVLSSADIDMAPELLNFKREPGRYEAEFTIPANILAPGRYFLALACGIPNVRLIDEKEGPWFEITESGSYALYWSVARKDVILALPMSWKTTVVL